MRLMLLPVDSRPCNTRFVEALCRHAGAQCVLPAAGERDWFDRPSRWEDRLSFVERELPRCDAAVLSLDQWCYGSLLASREESTSPETALNRIEALRQLLLAHPGKPVYASSVILRSSISVFTPEELKLHWAVTEYSQALDYSERVPGEESKKRLEAATAALPEALKQKLHRVRARNLSVNLAAIELVKEGLISFLSLLQEDSQPYGLHKRDQREILKALSGSTDLPALVRNGTDEAGAMLAARALSTAGAQAEAELLWLGDRGFTALYEDRPFAENLDAALREASIRVRAGSKNVLCVLCPPSGRQCEAPDWQPDAAFLSEAASRISSLISAGRRVYLLDLVCANGGTKGLLKALARPDDLWGYSAWNTASNAMGTLLAQVVTDSIPDKKNERFLYERVLDDLCYQSHIRQALQTALLQKGENIYHLQDTASAVQLLQKLYEQSLPELWPFSHVPKYCASLPWPRCFEVDVEVQA